MKIRGLLLACVVLAGLLGVLYWSARSKKEKEESPAAASPDRPRLFAMRDADIARIELQKKGGERIAFERNGAGEWKIVAPVQVDADQSACSVVGSTLSLLSALRIVEEKADDLTPYGLKEPAYTAALTQKDHPTRTLEIGDDTPTGNGMFARVEGDPRIYSIPSYVKANIDKTVEDLRDKRMLTLSPAAIRKVELAGPKQDLEFVRNGDQWQMTRPHSYRIDSAQVDELVRSLLDSRMDFTGPDPAGYAASFASEPAVATAKLVTDSGAQDLQLRGSKDLFLAKSSVVAGIFKVQNTLGTALAKTADDFRNKRLFDFGSAEPDKLELHIDGKPVFYTRSNGYWWSGDSTKMDVTSVQALVESLRNLIATRLVDEGTIKPEIEVAVTSNDGKRVEKILLSKNAGRYVAKRDDGPTLYELDQSTYEAVEKKAAAVKPASPPAR